MVETMRWEQGSLVLLDQTLLPQKIEWITCVDYKRVKVAIERLEVRGAPAIGAAAAFAMVLGAREVADKPDFLGALDVVRADLITARPTAVNLAWAANLQYALAVRLNGEDKSPAAIIKALEEKGYHFTYDDALVDYLVEKSYSMTYGARNLRRLIQKELEDPMAARIIDSFEDPITQISATAADGAVQLYTL